MFESVQQVFAKYAVFSGRARRREYWFFSLFCLIAGFVLGIVDTMLGLTFSDEQIGILGVLFTLATLVPGIAVTVRRLHDTGRSGWWALIAFVPIIGLIVLLVFACLDSEPGDNPYGPNPKRAPDAPGSVTPPPVPR